MGGRSVGGNGRGVWVKEETGRTEEGNGGNEGRREDVGDEGTEGGAEGRRMDAEEGRETSERGRERGRLRKNVPTG